MDSSAKAKTILAVLAVGFTTLIVFGLLWFFLLGPAAPVGLGWYVFSFAAGLSMIVLPCTLPLAFVIVPLSMGKGPIKGLAIALSFGLGVALMLSMYGVVAAALGKVAIGAMGAPLEVVKNWLYFIAGLFAYIFALGELGLVKFRMPTYTGAAPAIIQKQRDFIKAFLLGLFLGNVGIGCPHPATPVILTRIAVSGDIFYGWLLFFVHAVGRVLPLLLLAILGILGVNALSWLVARKDKVEKATGWGMVFVAGFILVLGLFSHDWWVFSGQHTLLEELTQEEKFLSAIIQRFNFAGTPHVHGMPAGTGLFGLPLALGNWVLVLLWLVPVWWALVKKQGENDKLPDEEKKFAKSIAPLYVAFAGLLSAFMVLTFVMVLPDRFLTHITLHELSENTMKMSDHHMDMETASGSGTVSSGHDMTSMQMEGDTGHASSTMYNEELDVKEGFVISMNTSPIPVKITAPIKLDFFVHTKPNNIPVSNLTLNHTKIMHVIGIRDDMNEFFHIHPDKTTKLGVYSVTHAFTQPGAYKIWSEVQSDGVDHVIGHPTLVATGSGQVNQKEVTFGKSVIAENHQVTVDYAAPIVQKNETTLTFDIHDAQGKEIELEDYLGTPMHLAVIKDDLKEFIHTHPESASHSHGLLPQLFPQVFAHEEEMHDEHMDSAPEPSASHGIVFHVTFPSPGVYKMFAQFRPKGSALPPDESVTASFWVRVEETAPKNPATWWWLLFASLIAIGVVSFSTYRYMNNVAKYKEDKKS